MRELDEQGRYTERCFSEHVSEVAKRWNFKEWLRRCVAKELHPDLQVQFDEMAATFEFDQGMPREAAEVRAAEIVFEKHNVL